MKEVADELKAMGERLHELFPDQFVRIEAYSDGSLEFTNFTNATYKETSELMGKLGCSKREKTPGENYTRLKGQAANGLAMAFYSDELPPTCHKEKYIEKIPKTQTFVTDEFIEIERTRIVCGEKVIA